MGRQLNPNRSSQAPSFIIVGQINGVGIPPPVNNGIRTFNSMVRSWFYERRLYNYTTNECAIDTFCNAYKQVSKHYIKGENCFCKKYFVWFQILYIGNKAAVTISAHSFHSD